MGGRPDKVVFTCSWSFSPYPYPQGAYSIPDKKPTTPTTYLQLFIKHRVGMWCCFSPGVTCRFLQRRRPLVLSENTCSTLHRGGRRCVCVCVCVLWFTHKQVPHRLSVVRGSDTWLDTWGHKRIDPGFCSSPDTELSRSLFASGR